MARRVSKSSVRARAIANGYRSGLEERNVEHLKKHDVKYTYETTKIKWVDPAKNRTYTPDFILENGIIIETKGWFLPEDRRKHIQVKKQHPDLDIRFVFEDSRGKINRGSKTTYGAWCDRNGFTYADKYIPIEWTEEEEKK
tara:strand:+ start:942 stop:1364 length:423 start_codon:yes stop_codon:yes gene_type:complete